MTKGVRVWPGHNGWRVKELKDKVNKRPLDVQEEKEGTQIYALAELEEVLAPT